MGKKVDLCPKCGNDRNDAHERDGTYKCWCPEDDDTETTYKSLLRRIYEAIRSKIRCR